MPTTQDSTLYQVIWQTRRLFQRLRAASETLLAQRGINPGQRAVLEFLYRAQPKTVPQIARERSVSRQHVQTLINDLLDLKLVLLVKNPDHKRSPWFKLSAKGRRLFESIQQDESGIINSLGSELSEPDLVTTLETLRQVDALLATKEAENQ